MANWKNSRRAGRWGALVLAAALATACGSTPTGQAPTGGPAGEDPGLAHVHGLGVDPADGALYAASHHGLFRVPSGGSPQRVGDSRQDTMGFTVVGSRHFLGSGHPDPRDQDAPHNLGLIESTDAGATWKTLSLDGEVDFHALEAKHGRVYGYDSQTGQIMISENRTDWDRRTQLAMADFAVDPANADTLLATTRDGVMRSTDGARTFAPLGNAPVLQLLDWATPDTLVGVDPAGGVHISADGGTTWREGGSVTGSPQAMSANGASAVYIATDAGIHVSTDAGKTFTTAYQASRS